MASATGLHRPEGRDLAPRRRLPGVRTLLLATYLAVLLLPVGGIGFLRLYESALIRQTEAELLAQAAVLSATYRAAWLDRASPEALAAMPAAKLDWGVAPTPASPERWRRCCRSSISPIRRSCRGRPIRCRPGRPADPIALAVAKTLAPVLVNVREMTLAGIRIVDAHGIVVASTANADLGLDMVRQEEVAEALRGAPVAMLRERAPLSGEVSWESISRTTALRVFVAVPVVADGRVLGAVLVSRTPRNIVQTLYSKRHALMALAVVLVASVTALAWFAGYTVVRPTRQLAAMARRVAAGDVRAVEPLAAPMTREAQSLSDSIVVLARTLQMRADYVRELALSISHELKTPLTGIRGSTELLRDHLEEMSAEDGKGSCRTSWTTPSGSSGWCGASSSWRGPTRRRRGRRGLRRRGGRDRHGDPAARQGGRPFRSTERIGGTAGRDRPQIARHRVVEPAGERPAACRAGGLGTRRGPAPKRTV